MTNGAIKSLGGPLFNTPPEVSHSLPPSISTFAPPNGLSPPNHSSEHPQTSANIATQLCNKQGIPFDKGMPEPDPPPSSLPDSEGTAAGGDCSGSAREVLLHSPTSNNSGSAQEALLYKRSSSPLRRARARPKAPPYRRRASGGVSKLPTWRTRGPGTVRDAHSSKFCWKVSYKHISFPLPLPPYAIPDMDHEDTKDKAQPPETVVFRLRRVLKKPPKDPTKSQRAIKAIAQFRGSTAVLPTKLSTSPFALVSHDDSHVLSGSATDFATYSSSPSAMQDSWPTANDLVSTPSYKEPRFEGECWSN